MLATLDDMAAIGAIRVNEAGGDAKAARASRLLDLVSAQVCAHLNCSSESALRAVLNEIQVLALAGIVAEVAGRRLNASAAPSSEFYPDGSSSLKLNRWDLRAIDDLFGSSSRGPTSFTVVRDTDTAYLSVVRDWAAADFDVIPT